MYGTRAAADGWQEEYSTFLVSIGFRQGEASANVFHHASRGITTSVHGDDFTSSGPTQCERRDGLITQECRRRTASAPYVPLGNHMQNQWSKT